MTAAWAHCPESEPLVTDDREGWLSARRQGVGGSDVPAILGMSRWSSPRDVWLDKTGRATTDVDSWAIRRGNALEGPLLDWFTDTSGVGYERVPLQRNITRPWMLGTPDALSEDGGIVECKTSSWRLRDAWEDGPADYAVIQGQWYLAVTGRSHLWVVAAVGDDEPTVERVERDDALISTMIDACERFWREHVEADVEPPLMWMDRDTVARQWPTVERTHADGDSDLDVWIGTRTSIAEQIKSLEKVKAQAEAEIIAALADADYLVIDGMVAATRKAQTARVIDMGALAAALAENGDSIDNYRTDRVSRVLRIPDPARRKEWSN